MGSDTEVGYSVCTWASLCYAPKLAEIFSQIQISGILFKNLPLILVSVKGERAPATGWYKILLFSLFVLYF